MRHNLVALIDDVALGSDGERPPPTPVWRYVKQTVRLGVDSRR